MINATQEKRWEKINRLGAIDTKKFSSRVFRRTAIGKVRGKRSKKQSIKTSNNVFNCQRVENINGRDTYKTPQVLKKEP